MRRAVHILIATIAALALGAGAAHAVPPAALTGAATDIGPTSATLTGTVDPNNQDTTYWFEYGTTAEYGSRTPDAGPLEGNADRKVEATITGLTPSTTYHFRLRARNAAGEESVGADATFTTPAAQPGSPAVTIAVSKTTVTFGKPVTISGTVTGNGAAGAEVTLEQNPFPFNGGFANLLQGTADAAGAYTFTTTPTVNTRYRVEARTAPRATSPEVQVNVRVRVSLRISDRTPQRGQRVRFSGFVTPAHDGTPAKIQRRTRAGWKTVAKPTLKTATPKDGVARSRYSKRIRVFSSSRWRTVVVPTDGDHVKGRSARKRVTVG